MPSTRAILGKLRRGMPVMVTRNQNKARLVVNGMVGTIHRLTTTELDIVLPNKSHIFVHPHSVETSWGTRIAIFPIVPAYAFTICTAQGKTFPKVCIYFDVDAVRQALVTLLSPA